MRFALTLIAFFGAMSWVVAWIGLTIYTRRRAFLADVSSEPPPNGWPNVAMTFAARNEQEAIERATRSMLALDYPNLQVIAVDDRSTDRTPQILAKLAAEDPRLKVVAIKDLPNGWLGKTHALHRAAESCDADWMVFTDADVRFEPQALKKAVRYAVTEGFGHVTVFPTNDCDNDLERAFLAFFALGMFVAMPPWLTENPKFRHAVGVGAFNLVSMQAMRKIGFFEHLKLSVDDDMRLAEALKRYGFASKGLGGDGELAIKWQSGVWGYVKGLEKNAFASMEFKPTLLAFGILGSFAIGFGPLLCLLLGKAWWIQLGGILGLAAIFGLLRLLRRGLATKPWMALAWPLPATLFIIAVLNSTYKTLIQGGIIWRGHLYPLAELKQHVRERARWFAEASANR